MADPEYSLIIPAAGLGKRMKSATPKPYLQLGGLTVLEHTLSCFIDLAGLSQVIVSTTAFYRQQTENILHRLFPEHQTIVVEGGLERQHSIYNALQKVKDGIELVAVHDAVRPFVSEIAIRKCLEHAVKFDGAILGVPVKDTIKKLDSEGRIVETPNRSELWQAQTPQIFGRKILMTAYNKALESGAVGTDDASLVEAVGGVVKVVKGSRDNFKLTYPLDFKIAELLVAQKKSKQL